MKKTNVKKFVQLSTTFGLGAALFASCVPAPRLVADDAAQAETTYARAENAPRETAYRLLAFVYREPGVCPACDRAKPIVKRLALEYPIELVYYDTPKGEELARRWNVKRLPTFVATRRTPWGDLRELDRWIGGVDLERKLRGFFSHVGVRPRRAPQPKPQPAPRPAPKPTPRAALNCGVYSSPRD